MTNNKTPSPDLHKRKTDSIGVKADAARSSGGQIPKEGEDQKAASPSSPAKSEFTQGGMLAVAQLILVALIIVSAFGTSFWLAGLREKGGPEIELKERKILVTSALVDPVTYRIHFDATGTVQARAPVSIVPRVSGRIVQVSDNLFPGGVFAEDEVLFQIEEADYVHEVERLKAELAKAQTALDLEQAEGEIAREEWETVNPGQKAPALALRKPQLREARARLAAARAQLATAELNLKRTKFSLPFEGRITDISAELGQYVPAGTPLGTAYAIRGLEVIMPLEDQEYGWILEAEEPQITLRTTYLGKEREITAQIKRLAAQYDPRTRLTRVVLVPETLQETLLPGVFTDVEVIGPARPESWLFPIDALQEDNSFWQISEENRLTRIYPEIINITNDYVAAQGDGTSIRVVTGSLPQASEGSQVRLRMQGEQDWPLERTTEAPPGSAYE